MGTEYTNERTRRQMGVCTDGGVNAQGRGMAKFALPSTWTDSSMARHGHNPVLEAQPRFALQFGPPNTPPPPTPKPANAPPCAAAGAGGSSPGAATGLPKPGGGPPATPPTPAPTPPTPTPEPGPGGLVWKEERYAVCGSAWMERNLLGVGRSSVLYCMFRRG